MRSHLKEQVVEVGDAARAVNEACELVVRLIQDMPLDQFYSPKAGNALFIDSSHVIKPRSGVEWELLYILAPLKSGVIVHACDICIPFEYPLSWLESSCAPGHYSE